MVINAKHIQGKGTTPRHLVCQSRDDGVLQKRTVSRLSLGPKLRRVTQDNVIPLKGYLQRHNMKLTIYKKKKKRKKKKVSS